MLLKLRPLWRKLSGKAASHRWPAVRPSSCRPRFEALEDRCLLNAGYQDPTFGIAGAGLVTQAAQNVLIQPNGQILAFQSGTVTRYITNGSIDTSFGSGGTAQSPVGGQEVLQPDGKILIAGVVNLNGTEVFGLERLNSNGSPDTTFGSGGEVTTSITPAPYSIAGVVVQPDGKIVIAGGNAGLTNASSSKKGGALELVRYTSNGSLDTSFGSQGKVVTFLSQYPAVVGDALLLQSNGDLIEVADTENFVESPAWILARYTPTGSLDTSFGTGGQVITNFTSSQNNFEVGVGGAVLQSNGEIVVAGQEHWTTGSGSTFQSHTQAVVGRYNTDGSVDTTFGSGGLAPITPIPHGVALDPNGLFVVAGTSGQGSTSQMTLERLNPDGTPDTTFGNNGVVTSGIPGSGGAGLAIYPSTGTDSADDGKIVVAGAQVARYLPTAPQSGPGFVVTAPSSVTAGVSFSITVTAVDANGNTLTGYTGTVDFGSFVDAHEILPANYTFTAADQGVHTFAVMFTAATVSAPQSLFVADTATPSMNGRQVGIQVNPGQAVGFVVQGPSSITRGTAFILYVTPVDAYGNLATGYTGTVGFRSSDSKAKLPSSFTFSGGGGNGGPAIAWFTLGTKGTQSITIFDESDNAILGTITIGVT